MGSSQSSNNSKNTMSTEDIRQFIEKENSSHQVVVWSKSYCPYCKQTKDLFKSMQPNNVDVAIHELDQHPSGSDIQSQLAAITGQRTVPNVFVQNKHLGGNDDTQKAHRSGELARMLQMS